MATYEERVEQAMAGFHADMAAEADRLRLKVLERLDEESRPAPPPSASFLSQLLLLRRLLRLSRPVDRGRRGRGTRAAAVDNIAGEKVKGRVIVIQDGAIVEVIETEGERYG